MQRGRRIPQSSTGYRHRSISSLSSCSSSTTTKSNTRKNRRGRRLPRVTPPPPPPPPPPPQSLWENLKVTELKEELRKRQLPVTGRKAELLERLYDNAGPHRPPPPPPPSSSSSSPATSAANPTNIHSDATTDDMTATTTTTNAAPSNKATDWKVSKAKAYLLHSLMDDDSPFHSMAPEDIHKSWSGFRDYPLKNFKTNLNNLKASVVKRKEVIKEDERIFKFEQERFPRKDTTTTGGLYWDKHPANALLHEDVKNGTASLLKPMELRTTKSAYQDFTVGTFCGPPSLVRTSCLLSVFE